MPTATSQQGQKRGSASRNGGHGSPAKAGRGSGEARPSKDGNAQRAAQEVPGLKNYQLGDCLGKGAFGSVYRALNWGTGETVAIKQIGLAALPKAELSVIMSEIDLLKNLNHPNIVKYHGFEKSPENLYIILEYCENGSLHSICKNFGKFPEHLVALYMSQVLQGLLYLHEQGVIHRDIKGANILTTKEGLVKLADFGVATKAQGLSESSVVGTPYWMAPEVIELSGATTASDIWSLGCTVIELLDGKPPYHKLQPMPALFRIVNDDHPPLPGGASPIVRDFLMQCFQKNPNLRISARRLLKHPWIMNAKRNDSVVRTKPTKYDEAVKSVQEWNEALKSPETISLRRSSRPEESSPTANTKSHMPIRAAKPTVPIETPLPLPKQRPNTDVFRSLDFDEDDNWDDDFASSINANALQLPHLKPQDNFNGLLSAEKLKRYASFDAMAEDSSYDDDFFDGDQTVKSPVQPLRSNPFTNTTNGTRQTNGSPSDLNTSAASEKDAKMLFSCGPPKDDFPSPRLRPGQRPPALFRENSVEDYSDLLAPDEGLFQKKVQRMKEQDEDSFSPKLFHPSDLKSLPRSSRGPRRGGSLHEKPVPDEEYVEANIRRTNSQVAIQKYAEDETEDFSDIFVDDDLQPSPKKDDSPSSSSEKSTLRMHITNKMAGSWLGDEEDEDPFAQLEEGLNAVDLESNVAEDRHARLCTAVESLVSSLKIGRPEDILAEVSDQIMQVLLESPDIKNVIISSHGMLPILELLETRPRADVTLRLLKIINTIILDNVEIQENLCFVGGIPIVTQFAHKKYPGEIRLQAAAFVRQVYQSSTLTLQMFISCGGLNVLVEFLEEDLETERDLVLIGVNGVWSVFALQGPTPKNDFCRIFSRSSVLYPLSLVLNKIIDEEGELAELIEERIVNIFLLFSQAENYVKEIVADRMVLKRVLKDLGRMSPKHQITMLKFVKNLSMLATTHDSLQNSNAIEVLTDLLGSSMKRPQFREISNQVLNIMYNLCRLSKPRQEDAALNGIVPLLQKIVSTEWPLKEFALPILCDMAHSGKVGRKVLWQNKGLEFYISLLADKYWQVTALDAIFIWLQEETARVEQALLQEECGFSKAVTECVTNADVSADAFENLLEPLGKILRVSTSVAATLAKPELFARLGQKLPTKKPVVRLNLLRIIRSICDATSDEGLLLKTFGVYEPVKTLADKDSAILVRELANELVKSCEEAQRHARRSLDKSQRRPSAASSLRRPSTSSGPGANMTPPSLGLSHSKSSPTTPNVLSPASPGHAYFDRSAPPASLATLLESHGQNVNTSVAALPELRRPSSRTPSMRPTSRDSNSSGSSIPIAVNSSGSNSASSNGSVAGKSRLPRTSISGRTGRLSLAPRERKESREEKSENETPTRTPSANSTSTSSATGGTNPPGPRVLSRKTTTQAAAGAQDRPAPLPKFRVRRHTSVEGKML